MSAQALPATGLPEPLPREDEQDFGLRLGKFVMRMLGVWQNNAPRTQQSAMRVLGMSELGGCREYIRASVAGDPKAPGGRVKWAAFVGTAVGDFAEQALVAAVPGARAQTTVTIRLPQTGISVTGHTDCVLLRRRLIDFKTRDGIDEVKHEGPKFKEKVQLSGYLIAAVEAGELDEDATGHLVYLDRSGRDAGVWVWTVTVAEARVWLQAADERLLEVALALQAGISQGYLRDEPESWCFHVECPFFAACWDGYTPTEPILNEEYQKAVANYDLGRELKKQGENIMRAARTRLEYPGPGHELEEGEEVPPPVEGLTDTLSLKWKWVDRGEGVMVRQIDVRKRRPGDTTIPLPADGESSSSVPDRSE